jgi:hypothetical protein
VRPLRRKHKVRDLPDLKAQWDLPDLPDLKAQWDLPDRKDQLELVVPKG